MPDGTGGAAPSSRRPWTCSASASAANATASSSERPAVTQPGRSGNTTSSRCPPPWRRARGTVRGSIDLLRGFVAGLRVDDIDFSTLQKLSAELRQRRPAQAARRCRVAGPPAGALAVPCGADRVPVAGRAPDGPAHPHLHGPAVRGAGAERGGGVGRTPAGRTACGAVQRRAAMAGGSGDARVDRDGGTGSGALSTGSAVPRGRRAPLGGGRSPRATI